MHKIKNKWAIALGLLVSAAILMSTIYFAFLDPPDRTYRVHGVQVRCENGTGQWCPDPPEWNAFVEGELDRFIEAGVLEDHAEGWALLRGLTWHYKVELRDDRIGMYYGLSRLGDHSVVDVDFALSPGTDGHELRIQLAWRLYGGHTEYDRMHWLSCANVWRYRTCTMEDFETP